MSSGVDITVVLGSFAGMLVGFYGIAKVMLAQAAKDRDSDRQERLELSHAIKEMADNSAKVATATQESAKQAEDRNGHLGEQNVHIADLVVQGNKLSKEIVDILTRSSDTLAKGTKERALRVREVKEDLEHSNSKEG